MLKDKYITIISPNTLACIGLKSILTEFFLMDDVCITNSYDSFLTAEKEPSPDLIFITPDIYVLHEYFQNIKTKVVLMLEKNQGSFANQTSLTFIDISITQTEIVDNLHRIFNSKIKAKRVENRENLSVRETEVLKLVARGFMNKQIADMLNISLHTIISHRKNLTRKLGINTVSGLTVYALLNGLITSDELENANFQRYE